MGHYSYLYVGEFELQAWKYDLPPRNDPLLSFIFDESDKKIVNTSNELFEYRYLENSERRKYTCRYDVTVEIAIERFNRYGFTVEGICASVSKLTGIPPKKVSLALRNYLDLSARLFAMKSEMSEMERKEIEEMEEKEINYDRYADVLREAELGNLPEIFVVRTLLERSQLTDKVVLDMHDIIDPGNKSKATKDFDNMSLFSEDVHSKISLKRRYLYLAVVHFASREIDLVYIDLIIALEASLKTYLSSSKGKLKNRGELNIDTFLKDVSLVNVAIFVLRYLKRRGISVDQVKRLEEIYNIRNNVIHGGMKNFDLTRVYSDICLIRELINRIGNGNSGIN